MADNQSTYMVYTEFEQDVSKDTTELPQVPVCSHTTQLTRVEGVVSGNRGPHHEKRKATSENTNKDIKISTEIVNIKVSGFSLVQIGYNSKLVQENCCEWCSNVCSNEYCHRSFDEGNNSVSKVQEIKADSHSSEVHSMPVIPKRGCLNSSWYILLIKDLHHLRAAGDFVTHEQKIQKQLQLAKSLTRDVDMEASLQIERAMARYFQNNLKAAKKILKFVLKRLKRPKREEQLKNPEILTGRALNFLTAVYKRQGKFGNAMTCVQKANSALEHQDSREDKAELYHSYGALLNSLPAAKSTQDYRIIKEEAYKFYEMACLYTSNNRRYIHVKMAALLLKSCSNSVNNGTSLYKEDVIEAKGHLDFIEFRMKDAHNTGLRTKINLLLLRSDQYRFEQNVAMAMEKAEEARELILRHGFELELVSAEKRISHLSEMFKKGNEDNCVASPRNFASACISPAPHWSPSPKLETTRSLTLFRYAPRRKVTTLFRSDSPSPVVE